MRASVEHKTKLVCTFSLTQPSPQGEGFAFAAPLKVRATDLPIICVVSETRGLKLLGGVENKINDEARAENYFWKTEKF
jgi:hypothetical protein